MNRDDANGSRVVEAVLKQLDDSHIFPPDHGFMRRIAYVETRDGTRKTAPNASGNLCHNGVGIWGLTEYMLSNMKHEVRMKAAQYQEVMAASEDICTEFGVNMTGHEKLNMRNPLVSGIAARFYFYYQVILHNNMNKELPEDLQGQAIFFKKSYKKTGINKFLEGVADIEGKTENVFIC